MLTEACTTTKATAQADSVDYFFPDAPPNATTLDSKAFRLRIGFAVLVDYTFIGQDAACREQVGPQLVGRFGYLDIDDSPELGGKLTKWYVGVNWWASRQWKLGV